MSEIEILELKNAITELKNSMESFGSRLDKQKREAVSLKIDNLKLTTQRRKNYKKE